MTIYRKAEEAVCRTITLSGEVLDLGGHASSPYRGLFGGTYTLTAVNMPGSGEAIECDLEELLPIKDAQYDGVLLMNVLEHIFEYRQLVNECARVLRPGGQVVIAAPFIFPYHPSPNDFHRYTSAALTRALEKAGFADIAIQPIGGGLYTARWLFLERVMPSALRFTFPLNTWIAKVNDRTFTWLARATGRRYDPADYSLGFVATATKR